MSQLNRGILVSIPHAGLLCPPEIALSALSKHQQALAVNTDWYTDFLYDFTDVLRNRQVVFPFGQVYINVNRHPESLDECVPLRVDDVPVYRDGREPGDKVRRSLVRKYHKGYHRALARLNKIFILDAHSTVTGHADAEGNRVSDDILVSDLQRTKWDPPGGMRTAPRGWLETYVEELEKGLRDPDMRVAANTTYGSTYGHIMAAHGWAGHGPRGQRAPLLLQETNEALYVKNGVPDVYRIEHLRRVFSEALHRTVEAMERR